MRRLKTTTLAAAVLALGLVASACSSGDSSDDASASATDGAGESAAPSDDASQAAGGGGTFIDGAQLIAVPSHIDPLLTSELDGAQISQALYDGLTEFANEDSGPVLKPLVAESWESNADATEFTFKIKDGLTFSDGTPVLPSSFKLGADIAADPGTAADYSYLYADVEGFDALQDAPGTGLSGVTADDEAMTVTYKLTSSYADFPARVSHIIFSPMPEARRDLPDQSQWERDVMIGNGPFKQEVPQNDQEIALVRNDAWAGDVYGNTSATLDGVTFRIFSDIDSAYAAFEAGETMSSSIPSGQYADATGKYGNTSETALLGSYHWVFGMRDTDPLGGAAKVKLRQAMSLAIDRATINDAVYDGSRELPTGLTPPGIPGYKDGLGKYVEYNLDDAKALLEEYKAGGGTVPDNIQLVFNAGAGHEDVAAIVQQNLEALGITTTQAPLSSETYFSDLRDNGCPGLCRAGWFWDFPIYDNGMYDLFHTDSIGGNNLGWYSSPAFDEAVNKARTTVDDAQREALFEDAEDILLNQDTAVAPMNWYKGDQVYADNVTGYAQEALGWVRYETITISE